MQIQYQMTNLKKHVSLWQNIFFIILNVKSKNTVPKKYRAFLSYNSKM
jgi:hypothetical protein